MEERCFGNSHCTTIHYVGEEGTLVYIDVGTDASLASAAKVFITRPDETTIEKPANLAIFNDSTNYISFVVGLSDFNQPGTYTGQAFVSVGSFSGWGLPFKFKVEQPISSSSSSSSGSVAE